MSKVIKNDFLIVCVYVDDMIYIRNSFEMMKAFKESMMQKIEMNDLGLMHYLGIEVMQDAGGISLCQKKYATYLLKKFRMLNCKASKTPLNANENLSLEDGAEKINEKYFRSMVGGLMYFTHTG